MSMNFNETLHSDKARIDLYGESSILLKFEKIRKLQGGKVDQILLEEKSAHQKNAYIIGNRHSKVSFYVKLVNVCFHLICFL